MTVELLRIEQEDVTMILKGKVPTTEYAHFHSDIYMRLKCSSAHAEVAVFNPETGKLEADTGQNLRPLFFENGTYQLLINADKDVNIAFKHEYEAFQRAITETNLRKEKLLTGNLDFKNEIGLSDLTIVKDNKPFLTCTIEVFPKKLDYQNDYIALIDEVNDEIYNLAYSFLKRTYTDASLKEYKDPTLTEFYRILEQHVEQYLKAIEQVERQPHHQLVTSYELVRGDKLRKQDSFARNYLRKNPSLFEETKNGIRVGNKTMMPTNGYLVKKTQTYDTHENRYVKWTMERIIGRLHVLKQKVSDRKREINRADESDAEKRIEGWQNAIYHHLQKPFWRKVGKLDRSVFSLVMQMGIGYRDVFLIYTWISQSLVLHADFYRMSLKDIATLYEYWSFLKVGQILANKCEAIEQNIVEVTQNGLYVNLSSKQSATRVYKHPLTGEHIELKYQYYVNKSETATVTQKPDTMLSISKVGKDYAFQYILDAKYRVNLDGKVGPLEENINEMHRYRDAIVAEQMNIYERLTFGAYVLFPWKDDADYRKHSLFLSINKVNIGGLPFLPNNTKFVEELLDNLLNKSGEQLQREGILPKGTVSYFKELDGHMLIIRSEEVKDNVVVPVEWVKDFGNIQYVAFANRSGIYALAEVRFVHKILEAWHVYLQEAIEETLTDEIYEIVDYLIVPRMRMQYAKSVSELLLPSLLLRILQRFAAEINVNLDAPQLSSRSEVRSFAVSGNLFELMDNKIYVHGNSIALENDEDELFRWVADKIISTRYNA